MERIDIAIVGGGASALFLANALKSNKKIVIFERGERLGRKLSATGNGQGNVTNLSADEAEYFSSDGSRDRVNALIRRHSQRELIEFFAALGVSLQADERGRVYPSGRQASSLTDALRFALLERGIEARLQSRVVDMQKSGEGFVLRIEEGAERTGKSVFARRVVLCAGGKAAKNFGTDGSAYALAERFGHTVTPLYPSLVQLKTDVKHTKTLKGIRINDGMLTAVLPSGKKISLEGDIIFTDYGVSGDAVFRISAFIADKIEGEETRLFIDFLPKLSKEEILDLAKRKKRAFPSLANGELLFGILNNQVGRAVMKRANGDLEVAAAIVKSFELCVKGSLGFDYAQVTKGGIPLSETGEGLESRLVEGLYFAGEILDVDGQCGGFNLQWAYASAMAVAEHLKAL